MGVERHVVFLRGANSFKVITEDDWGYVSIGGQTFRKAQCLYLFQFPRGSASFETFTVA